MSRNRFIALSVLLDAVFVNAGVVLAFLLRFGGELPEFNFGAYIRIAPEATVLFLFAGWVYGLYDPERNDAAWSVMRAATATVALGSLFLAALLFFGGEATASFNRLAFLIGIVLNLTLLVGWRLLFLRFGRIRWPEQRVVIVGTGPVAIELASELERRAKWGWRVKGLLAAAPEDAERSPEVGGYPVLGHAAQTAAVAREHGANRIIVVSPIALRELVESLVLADELRVRLDVVPELYEIFIGRVDALVGDIPLMQITSFSVPRYYQAAKRAIDIIGALVLLVLTSPLLLVASVAIVLTDGFPVLFRQPRVGKDMCEFEVWKLRTMVKDAEKLSGPVLAEEEDPRITPVGRVLRRYRIDELPQLVNILRGQMSFVGPRPERSFFVEQYLEEIPGYRERFRVKPGVTGLAQVSGGYATTPARKLKYDLIYMFHQNLAMDAQVVAETLRVVMTGRGAR